MNGIACRNRIRRNTAPCLPPDIEPPGAAYATKAIRTAGSLRHFRCWLMILPSFVNHNFRIGTGLLICTDENQMLPCDYAKAGFAAFIEKVFDLCA